MNGCFFSLPFGLLLCRAGKWQREEKGGVWRWEWGTGGVGRESCTDWERLWAMVQWGVADQSSKHFIVKVVVVDTCSPGKK